MGSDGFLDGYRMRDCEPMEWFVVFSEDSPNWWVRLLARGRFKHVSVFGKVERSSSWVFYDFHLDRARIMVVGDWEADVLIGEYAGGNTVVRFGRLLADDDPIKLRPGLWCVPAVAHIIGLRSCALRPDALFRQILAKGGEVVGSEGHADEAKDEGRPGAAAPAGSGPDRKDQCDTGSARD